MAATLVSSAGGSVELPGLVLNDRRDGGHLVVNPPREIWERFELSPSELTQWAFLVAATGQAMIEELPQLRAGCVNYWEAGNWALNDDATPAGRKDPRKHRKVHLHVFGRSPGAVNRDWRWGESPRFPDYCNRLRWAAEFDPLTTAESDAVARRIRALLRDRFGVTA